MNRFVPLILAAVVLMAHQASAATLSTLAAPDGGHDLVTWNTWKGQSFTLAATTSPSAVISVTLRLEVLAPNANFVVRIVGSSGTPGRPDMADIRAELRPVALPVGTAVALVTFARDPVLTFPALEADATYWLIAGMTAADYDQPTPAGLVRWHYAGAQGQDPGAETGWTVGHSVATSDTEGGDWVPVIETPFQFEMTAMPVPEPAAATMLLAPSLVFLRRRRSLPAARV